MNSFLPAAIGRRPFSANIFLVLLLSSVTVLAQTPVDEESPWPRTRTTNGHTVTLHLPQVETWTSKTRCRASSSEPTQRNC